MSLTFTKKQLQKVYSLEKNSVLLTHLPLNYHHNLSIFLKNVELQTTSPNTYQNRANLQHELHQLHSTATSIFNIRLRKIIKAAVAQTINGKPFENSKYTDPLTDTEEQMFNNLIITLSKGKTELLDSLL